jgi:hypothetical protein
MISKSPKENNKMDKKKTQRKKGYSCSNFGQDASTKKNILKIKWQRLILKGETCPRCESTDKELDRAVSTLRQSLAPLGIEIVLEKEELPVSEFKKDPLQSNRIWINNRLLEDWIEGEVGHSPCCDVCGPHECRTVEVKGQVYEVIPADMIIKARLTAASQLVIERKSEPCCKGT